MQKHVKITIDDESIDVVVKHSFNPFVCRTFTTLGVLFQTQAYSAFKKKIHERDF